MIVGAALAWLVSWGVLQASEAVVRRVIDGDTVQLSDGRLVRYLGIDTPEVRRREGMRWVEDPEPMGLEATAFNRRLVEGKRVRLEYDVQTHDRFRRDLAYVYVSAPGGAELLVNAELVRAGFAQPLTIPPNVKYAAQFRLLAEEARRERRGLWGLSARAVRAEKP